MGLLKVYKEPVKGEKYTIGIDTATGLAGDYTVMQVLHNRIPFEQVAVFRAKWSVVDAAVFANQLGRWCWSKRARTKVSVSEGNSGSVDHR